MISVQTDETVSDANKEKAADVRLFCCRELAVEKKLFHFESKHIPLLYSVSTVLMEKPS